MGRIMIAGTRTSSLGALIAAWAALVVPSVPVAAEAQELWHGTTVGMSVAEVQRLFPAARPIHEQDPARPHWVALLRADSVLADGFPRSVTFTFDDGHLINVVTTAGSRSNPGEVTGQDVSGVLANLKSKYGLPVTCKKEPGGDLFLACFWRTHGIFIGYMGRVDVEPMVLTFAPPWEEADESLLR